jgi:hypothetical protein
VKHWLIGLAVLAALLGGCGGGSEVEVFPTSARPPGYDDTSRRDKYFPVQYVLDSNVILATSLRRLEYESANEARILVEGMATAQSGPFQREYELSIVSEGGSEYRSLDTMTFDVDLEAPQWFESAVTLPLDAHIVGVRFKPIDNTFETKTYIVDLFVDDVPYTSSLEIYR